MVRALAARLLGLAPPDQPVVAAVNLQPYREKATGVLTVASAVFSVFFAASLSSYAQAALRAPASSNFALDAAGQAWFLEQIREVMVWVIPVYVAGFVLVYTLWLWRIRAIVLDLNRRLTADFPRRVFGHPLTYLLGVAVGLFGGLLHAGNLALEIQPWTLSKLPLMLLITWMFTIFFSAWTLVALGEDI